MTKFSLHKVALAACGGAAALMITISMAAPADAATGRSKFRATPEELRRHCWRIDETFWTSKRRYGCGEVIGCTGGTCRQLGVTPPPPPTYEPPTVYLKRPPDKNGDSGGKGGGRNSGGGGEGGGNSGAAGGPN